MLNSRLRGILALLSNVTDTCVLQYPVTILNNDTKSISAKLDVSCYDETEFSPIGLNMKLNNLISILKMFKEPKISINNNAIDIEEDDGLVRTSFITDNIDLLENACVKPELFDRVRGAVTVVSFDLTQDDIKRLKQVQGIYTDLEDVLFEASECGLKLSLGSVAKFNKSDNKFSIIKDVESTKDFVCAISINQLQRIPVSTYNVDLKYNERSNSYAVYLTCAEYDGLEIMLSTLAR